MKESLEHLFELTEKILTKLLTNTDIISAPLKLCQKVSMQELSE